MTSVTLGTLPRVSRSRRRIPPEPMATTRLFELGVTASLWGRWRVSTQDWTSSRCRDQQHTAGEASPWQQTWLMQLAQHAPHGAVLPKVVFAKLVRQQAPLAFRKHQPAYMTDAVA